MKSTSKIKDMKSAIAHALSALSIFSAAQSANTSDFPEAIKERHALLSGSVRYSIATGNTDLLDPALKAGFDPNAPIIDTGEIFQSYPDLALHFAVMRNHTSCVKSLLKKGADVNKRDRFYNLPIHYYVEYVEDGTESGEEKEYVKLIAPTARLEDSDALLQLTWRYRDRICFVSLDKAPFNRLSAEQIKNWPKLRNINRMEEKKNAAGGVVKYVDKMTGEAGGVLSVEIESKPDTKAKSFNVHYTEGFLAGDFSSGTITVKHNAWIIKVLNSGDN